MPPVEAKITLTLTEGEALSVMSACLDKALEMAQEIVTDEEPGDLETCWELQKVAKSIQRAVRMPDDAFFSILAQCYGTPAPEVSAVLIRAQETFGGRKPE